VADLITHAAAAVLVKAATRWRYTPVFVAGTLAPDLFSRVPALAFGWLFTEGLPVPPVLTYGWDVMHQPLGMCLLAYLLAMFFVVEIRSRVFLNLLGGMFFHLGVDMLQHHLGAGYLLLYPVSDWAFEFGWIGSEDTVWVALPMALGAVVVARAKARATTGVSQPKKG
jgi:hypothetical protein